MRTITIYAFCSVKGGVGKSTLAVTTANLLAAKQLQCVVIDADLTGASLSDGLHLCAPRVNTRDDGSIIIDAEPTHDFLSVDETRRLRDQRNRDDVDIARPPPPPFFNDALGYLPPDPSGECQVESILWREDGGGDDGPLYLPSSPLRPDVELALGWLYREEHWDWAIRFAWILDAMCEQLPRLSDVIIDLPPGLFGFSHATLGLLSQLAANEPMEEGFPSLHSGRKWNTKVFLVTSQDRQDLFASVETYSRYLHPGLPSAKLLLNRRTEPMQVVKDVIKRRFGVQGVEETIRPISYYRHSLGRLFIDGKLKLHAGEQSELEEVLLGEDH